MRIRLSSQARLGIAGAIGAIGGASIVVYSMATQGPPPVAAGYVGVAILLLLGIFIAWPGRERADAPSKATGTARATAEERELTIRWSGVAVAVGAVGFTIGSVALADRDGGGIAWIGLTLMAGSFAIGVALFLRARVRARRRVLRRRDRGAPTQ
jgi:hypothetical protein